MSIEIIVEGTPNPNAVRISANQILFEGPKSTSLKSGAETDHPLARALVSIDGIDNIFGINDFVTITKEPDADWDAILSKVEEAFTGIYG